MSRISAKVIFCGRLDGTAAVAKRPISPRRLVVVSGRPISYFKQAIGFTRSGMTSGVSRSTGVNVRVKPTSWRGQWAGSGKLAAGGT